MISTSWWMPARDERVFICKFYGVRKHFKTNVCINPCLFDEHVTLVFHSWACVMCLAMWCCFLALNLLYSTYRIQWQQDPGQWRNAILMWQSLRVVWGCVWESWVLSGGTAGNVTPDGSTAITGPHCRDLPHPPSLLPLETTAPISFLLNWASWHRTSNSTSIVDHNSSHNK